MLVGQVGQMVYAFLPKQIVQGFLEHALNLWNVNKHYQIKRYVILNQTLAILIRILVSVKLKLVTKQQ